jgi:catechol 2,3-dioxygenase-like lactoylglutathione lyase family enzyme
VRREPRGYLAPITVALFAGIRVRDLTSARAWYERLLGEPTFFPNATEVVWTLADDRSLYIEEDPGRAGGALITVFVDDLDAAIAEIGSRGLEPAERETYSNGVRKATYRDDDGNEIGFGGLPLN